MWQAKAIAALKDSVEHWKRLRDRKPRVVQGDYSTRWDIPGEPYIEGPYTWDCACCAEFLKTDWPEDAAALHDDEFGYYPTECFKCPLRVASDGEELCEGGPWRDARRDYVERECPGGMEKMIAFLEHTLEAVKNGEITEPQ